MANRFFSLSIRTQLTLLALILAIPAATIIFYSGFQTRKEAMNAARAETRRLTDNIATGQQNLIAAAQQLIIALAQLPDVKQKDAAQVEPPLKDILALNAQYSNIFMADHRGQVWAAAIPIKPPDISDRRYFRNAVATGRLSSGEFIVSRATGRPSFNLAYPQKNARGVVSGTICVGFIVDYFKQMMERLELPRGMNYAILDHAGVVMGGKVVRAELIGKQGDAVIFKRMQEGPDADTFIGTGIDRNRRIISYRRLYLADEKIPYMYIRSGIPVDIVLSEANRSLSLNLALFTSFFVAAFIIAWRISRRSIVDRVSLLENASRRLASGDLQVRVSDVVSGGELGSLGQTFDMMASQLAKREQALRESEERFRSIYNAPMDGIVVTDVATKRFIMGNRMFYTMLGCTEEELRAMGAEEIHPPEAMPRVLKHLEETLRGEISVAQEMPVLRRDGTVFYADIGATLAKLGERMTFIGVFRDVTERKRATEEQQKLVSIIETSADLIGIADLEGRLLYLNAAGKKLVGLEDLEAVRKKSVAAFHLEKDRGKFETEIFPTILDAGSWRGQIAFRHFKTGEPISVEMYGFLIRDPKSGQPMAVANISRDMTDRKRAAEERTRLLDILERSINEIYLFDAETLRFRYVNAGALRNLGYPLEKIKTMTPLDIKPEFTGASFHSLITPLLAHQKDKEVFQTVHRRNDGSLYPVEVHLQLVEQEQERMFLAVIIDITDRKQAEEEKQKLQSQLLQAQKMEAIGQLAGGVAHDFNNILSAIIGYSNLIQMNIPADDPSRLYIEQILASSERAASLTQSLLAFSRKQVINPKNLEFNDCIRKVEKFLSRIIGEDITLTTLLSMQKLPIFADNTQIEQILMNLATNARDAMPKGGALTIETGREEVDHSRAIVYSFEKPGPYAVLTVRDTGIGMDGPTQEKMFDPFFTTKGPGKGTGLGLSIVYGIVKQNNGNITVESEVGKGSTFKIYFPIVQSGPEYIAHTNGSSELPGGTETILLAEDDVSVRKLTRQVLSTYGYTVIESVDGEDALNKLTENRDRIRLLIVDVIMPKKNGREVYEEAKKILPHVKVLFTSGYPADLIQKEGVLETGLRFLPKPASPQDILRTVRDVLDE